MPQKVLVTGAAGILGTIITEDLGGEYAFTRLDVREIDGPNAHRVDVARDYDALLGLMAGHHAVLHMAYVEEEETGCENVLMAKNVFHAAMATSPHPRIILASSVHVVGGHLNWGEEPYVLIARNECDRLEGMPGIITTEHPLRPNGLYGAMKGYLELMGTYYASRGLEVVAIRFGGVRLDDRMVDEPGYHAIWLSRRDCGRIILMALDAKLAEPYVVVFAVSNNRHRVHDLASSKRSLGYEPMDSAERNG